jgi:uncharacterized protein
MAVVGLISDTHGLLRPEALDALRGSVVIVHAGDVGDPRILAELERIAPVTAVRGNVDRGDLARRLPGSAVVTVEGVSIYVLHILEDLDLDPSASGLHVVVTGHTHDPVVRMRRDVLYVNPGSAGPRRFRLPVTVAHLTVGEGAPRAEIITLPVAGS